MAVKVFFVLIWSLISVVPIIAKDSPKPDITLRADSLQLVYLANVNANYENCLCGAQPLGGMDRVIAVVKQWRAHNPNLLVFDGGDFLNAYPFAALNQLMLKLYRLLQPNVICLGDQELQVGNSAFQKEIINEPFPILNTNVILGHFPLRKAISIKLASHKISVLSYLDASSFLWEKPADNVIIQEAMFQKNYRQALRNSDFRIAIFHGEQNRLAAFVKNYPDLHLILLSHVQSKTIKRSSFPWVIGVGTDSEYVTRISIIFVKGKAKPLLRLKSVPVALTIPPDPAAQKLITQFKAETR